MIVSEQVYANTIYVLSRTEGLGHEWKACVASANESYMRGLRVVAPKKILATLPVLWWIILIKQE